MESTWRKLPFLVVVLVSALALGACADDPVAPGVADDMALAPGESGSRLGVAPVAVMSRNLYLGADFSLVLAGRVEEAWQQVMRTNFELRAAALAAEMGSLRPDLIGLQEVSLYVISVDHPQFGWIPVHVIDYLDLLIDALAVAGVEYVPAEAATNVTATIPIPDVMGLPARVTYTDGDAILALDTDEVEVHGSGSWHFQSQVSLRPLLDVDNLRGYQWADVTVRGQRFHFINTHLEVQSPASWGATQERQAGELLAFVDGLDGPVLMVGDYNSAANPDAPMESRTASYSMILGAGFDDLWLRHHGRFTTEGVTCCHFPDLSNPEPALDQRIDFVFARNVPSGAGYAGGVVMEVVGDEAADIFTTVLGYDLWPSDHAGLFASLRMPIGLMADR